MLATIISGIFSGNGKTPQFLEYGYTKDVPRQRIVSGFDTVDGELIQSRSTEKPLFANSCKVPAIVGVAFGFWVELPSNVFAKPLRGAVHHPAMGPESRTNQTWPLKTFLGGGCLSDTVSKMNTSLCWVIGRLSSGKMIRYFSSKPWSW